jgi:hypothetical protein
MSPPCEFGNDGHDEGDVAAALEHREEEPNTRVLVTESLVLSHGTPNHVSA